MSQCERRALFFKPKIFSHFKCVSINFISDEASNRLAPSIFSNNPRIFYMIAYPSDKMISVSALFPDKNPDRG
jgi:hypothetical protein